jgi:hypothetical protein
VASKGAEVSDVIAILEATGEKLICVDFDRPVWYSKVNPSLRAIPDLDHFVVDGLLACLDGNTLKAYGIMHRFHSEDFEKDEATSELRHAREILYQANDLKINYFHDLDGDIQIHQDLARFKMPLGKVIKVTSDELSNLTN